VLACDLLPSSGEVLIDGLDVVDRSDDVRALIGYLPDHPPLYDEMTVREYLLFTARLRGMLGAEAERRVAEVEATTQLERVSHDAISTLSHGFRQRVGIAQAIVHKPRLLVLDEPISGLDPVQIVEMRETLRRLGHEHTTIISSHILSEISETCDRLLVIRDGQIVASGTEEELSNRLLGGGHVLVTVRGNRDRALSTLRSVSGVSSVEEAHAGDGIVTFRLEADRDVREAACKALVGADLGILELTRSERELESIFLRLAGSPAQPTTSTATEASASGAA
jgi:ABC-2 type transport system ATP-binding protein